MKRAFACLFFLLAGIATLTAVTPACDPLPDECDYDDNVCDGNVANICFRPTPESRLRGHREDCGRRRCVVIIEDGHRAATCTEPGETCSAVGLTCANGFQRWCRATVSPPDGFATAPLWGCPDCPCRTPVLDASPAEE